MHRLVPMFGAIFGFSLHNPVIKSFKSMPLFSFSSYMDVYMPKKVDAGGFDPVISTVKICKNSDLRAQALKAEMSTPIMVITMRGNG